MVRTGFGMTRPTVLAAAGKLPCSLMATAALCLLSATALAAPALLLDPLVVAPGEQAELSLVLQGGQEPYAAVNAIILLPEGVDVVSVAPGELLQAATGFTIDSHTAAGANGATLGLIAYSGSETITATQGPLLAVRLAVSPEMPLGDYDIAFAAASTGLSTADGLSVAHQTAPGALLVADEPVTCLTVTPDSRSVPSAGGETSFLVRVAGSGPFAWTASVVEGSGWAQIVSGTAGSGDGVIALQCSPNAEATPRSATIVVDGGGMVGSPATVTVEQEGDATPALLVSPTQETLPAMSGLLDLHVANTGNGTMPWSARIAQGLEWLSVLDGQSGTDSGTITLAYLPNTTELPRVGIVEIVASGAVGSPAVAVITQEAPAVLSVSPVAAAVGSAENTVELTVRNLGGGTMAWSAEVVSGQDWLTIAAGAAGTGDGQVRVSCAQHDGTNSRTGMVAVRAPGALDSPVTVDVVQAGDATPLLSVMPPQQSVDAHQGVASFSVANAGHGTLHWTATIVEGAAWLSIDAGATGTDEGTIRVAFAENDSENARTGVLRVEAADADGSPADVSVVQAGRQPLELTAPNGGEWWKRGTANTIAWSSVASVDSVAIVLMKGGGFCLQVAVTVHSTGTHQWTLPPDLEPGDDYQIQIIDVADSAVHDESDQDFAINCPPEPPANVSATQGEPGLVTVTWDPVDSAIEYAIYRSDQNDPATAQLMGVTTAQVYEDLEAPEPLNPGIGCRGDLVYQPRYYWVKAINVCRESDVSEAAEGWRGPDADDSAHPLFEWLLPHLWSCGATICAGPDAVLCVRLRSDEPIDPGQIAGAATWSCGQSVLIDWLPIDCCDGWVILRPDPAWPVGDTVEVTVAGVTVHGHPLGPITRQFSIAVKDTASAKTTAIWQPGYEDLDLAEMDVAGESNTDATVSVLGDDVWDEAWPEAAGSVFLVGPDRAFETPQRVWLPLPEWLAPEDAAIQYCYKTESGATWAPGEAVEGWLVPDSLLAAEFDGVTYLGLLVRHGGLVHLASRAATSVPVNTAAGSYHIALAALALALGLPLARAAAARRRTP